MAEPIDARRARRAVALLLPVLAVALGAAAPAAANGRHRTMTVLTPATALAARTDRRPVAGGLYDPAAGRTFISWGGVHEDNFVQSYDHRAATWSAPVKVGDGGDDSHNYPVMVQAKDGHLLVFRGVHNTELVVARSPLAHSIEGQWTEQTIAEGNGATYPMPFTTRRGDIFVFVRETAHDLDPTAATDFRPMKYVRSTDNGLTWQNAEQLTGDKYVIAPNGRPDNLNEVYIGQLRYEPGDRWGRGERVQIVYTLAGGGPEGHLHDRYHHNIYAVTFTPRDLHFHSADGRDLGVSIDDAAQEAFLKVADTPLLAAPNSRSPDYIQLVGSALGRPFVVWMQLDDAGVLHDFASVHTARGWRSAELGTGVRVRDMEPVDWRTWRVYATLDSAPNGISTYLLRADRSGVTWRPESVIATPKAVQRIEVISGHRDPVRILATGASSAREVTTADGDVYVAGFARRRW
jgi:hypothetical protein